MSTLPPNNRTLTLCSLSAFSLQKNSIMLEETQKNPVARPCVDFKSESHAEHHDTGKVMASCLQVFFHPRLFWGSQKQASLSQRAGRREGNQARRHDMIQPSLLIKSN